ncbi:MAG: uncharacterized protein KVP18_001807 [Porospora cf. gigantea A]|uniref:uncharacterized protein n=1 Tax=Porospora cf. gigantea A TaxID=2853593 RepID=UPI00355A00CF|nr:MAG: hypothetical protein KVP18_001807 [Porospora cf. gigantea A]
MRLQGIVAVGLAQGSAVATVVTAVNPPVMGSPYPSLLSALDPLVIFADSSIVEEVWDLRSHARDDTVVIEQHAKPAGWFGRGPELDKFKLMAEAVELNPFNSDVYLWMDSTAVSTRKFNGTLIASDVGVIPDERVLFSKGGNGFLLGSRALRTIIMGGNVNAWRSLCRFVEKGGTNDARAAHACMVHPKNCSVFTADDSFVFLDALQGSAVAVANFETRLKQEAPWRQLPTHPNLTTLAFWLALALTACVLALRRRSTRKQVALVKPNE